MSKLVKLNKIQLKSHPNYDENWLHKAIASDPSILGLGDLVVKDHERIHSGLGRLDLLLQDAETYDRYEVEIQLGKLDESHIIRTIEYWDIERKRYPQYNHTAVIVAEDITSRFLNVISLFNGHIPIIALQLTAIETSDGIGLHFTKVLDAVSFGLVGEDEDVSAKTDRTYWEKRGSKHTLKMADEILAIVKEISPNSKIEQSYNKHYIGFYVNGRPANFAICRPQKSALRLEFKLNKSDEIDEIISNNDLDDLDYDKRWGSYRIKITENDLNQKRDVLRSLLEKAYKERF